MQATQIICCWLLQIQTSLARRSSHWAGSVFLLRHSQTKHSSDEMSPIYFKLIAISLFKVLQAQPRVVGFGSLSHHPRAQGGTPHKFPPFLKYFSSHSYDCGLRFAIISIRWDKTTSAGQEAAKTGEYYEKG